jgi:hypothetical protein
MTTLQIEVEDATPVGVACDNDKLTVQLNDGRVLQAPLWWYPCLASATPETRARVELSPMGMHWPEIDEDISIASILRGREAPRAAEADFRALAERQGQKEAFAALEGMGWEGDLDAMREERAPGVNK